MVGAFFFIVTFFVIISTGLIVFLYIRDMGKVDIEISKIVYASLGFVSATGSVIVLLMIFGKSLIINVIDTIGKRWGSK